MSCVDELESRGYWTNTEHCGFTVSSTRYGNAHYECDGGKCIFVLAYSYKPFRRVRIRYNISIIATGANPTATYTCATGFAIERLVIWLLDPMEKLFEAMGTLIQLLVILQLLTSLLSAV